MIPELGQISLILSLIIAVLLASLPLLVEMTSGVKVLITETDLQDYPGLWMHGTAGKNGNLVGTLPYFPKSTVRTSNRDIQPVDRDYFLAKTSGKRSYPWRLFLVAEHDADLLGNQMPWLLAEPSRISDTDWIRPGKVAWDWWSNLNLEGVNFRAGVNTETVAGAVGVGPAPPVVLVNLVCRIVSRLLTVM